MEFKIRMKFKFYVIMFAYLLFVFAGGLILGLCVNVTSSESDKTVLPFYALMGIVFTVGATVGIIMQFKELSRDQCEIDIDSFTESAIQEGVEKRWNKVKEVIISNLNSIS